MYFRHLKIDDEIGKRPPVKRKVLSQKVVIDLLTIGGPLRRRQYGQTHPKWFVSVVVRNSTLLQFSGTSRKQPFWIVKLLTNSYNFFLHLKMEIFKMTTYSCVDIYFLYKNNIV